jgi:hypothetical protein
MKTRLGFVSNSSSASFIVKKAGLSPSQKYIVENYVEAATKSNDDYKDEVEGWSMLEEDDHYEFWTSMDNFSLNEFFDIMGIKVENLEH